MEASLRPYHIVATGDLRPLVMKVLNGFPRSLKVKCKEEAVIARIGQSGKFVPVESVVPEETEKKAAESKDTSRATFGFETDFFGAGHPSLVLENLPLPFPVPALDPAFPIAAFPAPLEVDPALVNLMQAFEQQQAIFNHALMLNMHAQQLFQPDHSLLPEMTNQKLTKC
jgi:hypothetical protein